MKCLANYWWSQGGHCYIQEILLKMLQAAKFTILRLSTLREQNFAKAEVSHTCQNLCKLSSPCKSLTLKKIRFRFVLVCVSDSSNIIHKSGKLSFIVAIWILQFWWEKMIYPPLLFSFVSPFSVLWNPLKIPGFGSQLRSEMFVGVTINHHANST